MQLAALTGQATGMRIHTVRRSDWRDYREIRLAALKDAPSAFASTWQEEASLTAAQWRDRARRSQGSETLTMVVAATSPDLAVVRMHGHSDKWESKDIHERFGYRYTETELTQWAPKVRALARDATDTHVLFNNCYRDYAQVNAQRLTELLGA